MGTVALTDDLRAEYTRLFAEADIPEDKQPLVVSHTQKIIANWPRYETVATSLGIPPHPIALIHAMESDCDFSRHLHNGDPLSARTVHEPPNRPAAGDPPFTWEQSALDAMRLHKLDKWTDWSIPGLCYVLERYNGWGYRLYHSDTKSPYLWSFTSIYTSGKYTSDGKWSNEAVSKQIGAMALLVELVRQGKPFPVPSEVNGVQILTSPATPVVAPAQVQSAPQVLPAGGLGMAEVGSAGAVPQVREDVSDSAGLTAILKTLAKSKTMGGVVGLFVMQLFGMSAWDVAIRVGGQIYTVPDLSPYIATALAGLATWGRITAKQINEGKSNA